MFPSQLDLMPSPMELKKKKIKNKKTQILKKVLPHVVVR
jgi:hypothetical protein